MITAVKIVTLPVMDVQQQDLINVLHVQQIIMTILEIVKLAVLISIMVTPHMFAKVVTVPVIIVMVIVIISVLHVLQPNIWLTITLVKIVI